MTAAPGGPAGPSLPDAVIFVGVQGAGKSTFYKERFFDTHIRINLDMLKTRHREKVLFETCLALGQRLVVDNTNPTVAERARYIGPAKAAGFRVVGYYFETHPAAAAKRNADRFGKQRVPAKAIFGTHKRLEPPALAEGFDALWVVRIAEHGTFIVAPWPEA